MALVPALSLAHAACLLGKPSSCSCIALCRHSSPWFRRLLTVSLHVTSLLTCMYFCRRKEVKLCDYSVLIKGNLKQAFDTDLIIS